MLDEGWLNDDNDAGDGNEPLVGPTRSGGQPTVVVLVKYAIENNAGLGREGVSDRVNEALRNAAWSVSIRREANRDLGSSWQDRADGLRTGGEERLAEEAEIDIQSLNERIDSDYDAGRMELADAVSEAMSSRRVEFTQHTGDLLSRLDHDGLLSKRTGVDVKKTFAANAAYTGQRPATPAARSVDFSREAVPSAEPAREAKTPEQVAEADASLARARARAAVERKPESKQASAASGPVKAGDVARDVVANLKAGRTGSGVEEPAAPKDDGPEFG